MNDSFGSFFNFKVRSCQALNINAALRSVHAPDESLWGVWGQLSAPGTLTNPVERAGGS